MGAAIATAPADRAGTVYSGIVLRKPFVASLVLVLVTGPLVAQVPLMTVGVECIPSGGNGVVDLGVAPDVGGDVRVYFRRAGYGDYYYVPAETGQPGSGVYWSVLPVPEPDNVLAEYYGAVVDPAGRFLGQTPVQTVPISDDCEVDLTEPQRSRSSDLTVGETSIGQKSMKVAWWQCEGVDQRIDLYGEERHDDSCIVVAILPVTSSSAWYLSAQFWVPFGVLAGGIALVNDDNPAFVSPSEP